MPVVSLPVTRVGKWIRENVTTIYINPPRVIFDCTNPDKSIIEHLSHLDIGYHQGDGSKILWRPISKCVLSRVGDHISITLPAMSISVTALYLRQPQQKAKVIQISVQRAT